MEEEDPNSGFYGLGAVPFSYICYSIFIKMGLLKDLWGFLRERKKYWLMPIILVLVLLGLLIVVGGGSSIAPFIYSLF
ncbi:MAG: hypothetical protein ACI8P3_003371 [Saprospiraceae bacterium]|jgi:hypothetical protein